MQAKGKALLIIDMQKGSFTRSSPRFGAEKVVERINSLIKLFRQSGFPVFFIQHNGARENTFIPNTSEWELLSGLDVESDSVFIEKQANDCFYESLLSQKLKELNIDELFVTGCATDFCVEATVQSALAKNYNIIVARDAHTTADRPHIKAEKVIEHYNWVWRNMIPTKGKIKVLDSKMIELNLKQQAITE